MIGVFLMTVPDAMTMTKIEVMDAHLDSCGEKLTSWIFSES